MFVYQYQCNKCEHITEAMRTLHKRNCCPACEKCGGKTVKLMVCPIAGINSGKGSRCGTGTKESYCTLLPGENFYVKSKDHFREECKKHGLYPAGL